MTSDDLNVSRETSETLRAFEALVKKWNPAINLISKASLPEIWTRHIADSAQIFDIAPPTGHWVDLGSGGGFPGIVAAILSRGADLDHKFTLIESDKRKAVFLRTAAREFGLSVTVLSDRIEKVEGQGADILTARALTDLAGLLGFAERHLAPTGICLLPKGEKWQEERADAQAAWHYHLEAIKSVTNPKAAILKIKDIKRV